MSKSQNTATLALQQQLASIRHQFADTLLRSMAIVAIFGIPLSIIRAFNTGWLPLYTAHLLLGLVLLLSTLYNKQLSLPFKGMLLVLVFWLAGLPGTLNYGYASPGVWWLLASCLVAYVLFKARVALILAGFTLLCLLAVAAGFISNSLTPPHSATPYLSDPATWAAYLLVNFMVLFVIIRSFISYTASLQATTQHQFRQWIEDLPVGIVVLGPDLKSYYANHAATEMFGAQQQAHPIAFVAGTNTPYPMADMPAMRALRGETCQIEELEIESAGQRRYVQAWGRPTYNSEGHLTFGIAVYEDISARKQLDLLKNQFVSTVSHELRTPLTAIHGALGLVLGNALGTPEPKIRAMLEIAEQNSQRLIRLINDILDMQKVEAGQMAFHFSRIQLAPWLSQAIKQLEGYAVQHQVTFELAPVADDLWLSADPNRLMQVLANLLSNAAKFSPADATVHIRAQRHADFVRIAIEDHGSGIDEDFKAVIFRPFSQSDTSDIRRFGGTGLGLSISKSIVEHHGGALWFESTLGQGSTFYIDLKLGSDHIVNS